MTSGVLIADIIGGVPVPHIHLRTVVVGGTKTLAVTGVDLAGEFGSTWNNEHGEWLVDPHPRATRHAMRLLTALSNKDMDIVRWYHDQPNFDWTQLPQDNHEEEMIKKRRDARNLDLWLGTTMLFGDRALDEIGLKENVV